MTSEIKNLQALIQKISRESEDERLSIGQRRNLRTALIDAINDLKEITLELDPVSQPGSIFDPASCEFS